MCEMWLVLAAAALLPPVAVAGSRIWNQHGDHPAPLASSTDIEQADFATCGATRQTCVVDGDTFWYHGAKIRIADINTPEVSEPECPAEAELGARATERLVELLNQGPFTLEPIDLTATAACCASSRAAGKALAMFWWTKVWPRPGKAGAAAGAEGKLTQLTQYREIFRPFPGEADLRVFREG